MFLIVCSCLFYVVFCFYTAPLTYDYSALGLNSNGQIMQRHHSKHHVNCVSNLKATKEKFKEDLAKGIVTIQVSLQPALVSVVEAVMVLPF